MLRILHVKDLQALSALERKLLFFFAVFPGNHTVADFIAFATAVSGHAPTPMVVQATMHELESVELIQPGLVSRGTVGSAWRLVARFTRKSLQRLGVEATTNGWWPSPEALSKNLAGSWLGAELAFAVRNFVSPMQVWQVVETLKALIVGDAGPIGAVPMRCDYPLVSVHWTAVSRWLELLDPSEPLEVESLPPGAAGMLFPVLFEQGYLGGRDVRPLLEAARAAFGAGTAGTQLASSTLCAYCALCVWTGQRDLLNGAASLVSPGSPAERFAALCLDVFEGRFEEAEKSFANGAADFRSAFATDVSSPMWLLGMALALRQGAPLNRVSKYAAELKREVGDILHWHPVARFAFAEALKRRAELVGLLMSAISPDWKVRLEKDEGDPLEASKQWFRCGYPTMAALALAEAARRHPELKGVEEFGDALGKNGSVPLVKTMMREPKWKLALRELEERLPANAGAAHGEQALPGSVGWELELTSSDLKFEDRHFFVCTGVKPFYRGPRAAADGSNDRTVTVKALSAAKYRACLTACDVEILQELTALGGGAVGSRVSDKVLGLLCGHPRLKRAERGPMTLTRVPCELRTTRTEEGGMVLALPEWLVGHVGGGSLIGCAIEEGGSDETRPTHGEFHPITKRVCEVVAVMVQHGTEGRLEIPSEGLAQAKELLVRLAGEMTVGGDFAEVVGGGVMRREGSPTPHVRLVYANDELSVTLVVVPIDNRSVAVCEPGMGLPERLVQLRGGRTVLLVRDLQAEEAAAEVVRNALEPFAATAVAKNRWSIADASSALEALRILKSLDGVKLDWPEGEKLRVSQAKASRLNFGTSGEDWFSVDGEVELDDGRVLKLIDLLHALSDRDGNYVHFGENEYIYLSQELLRRMDALAVATGTSAAKSPTKSAGFSSAALPMLAKAFEGGDGQLPELPEVLTQRSDRIAQAFRSKVEIPRYFKGTLRDYQEKGFAWMARLASCGFGACLADDMGLGKTVQVIALLLARKVEGPSLVIAPASVCHNWGQEIERFAPTLNVVVPGDEKELPELGAGDVVVASYGLLVTRAEAFESVVWNGVVLDEAQAVKNAETQRAQIARKLRSKFRVAATGTPVENRLGEFASIFEFLNPGLLGPAKTFEERFVAEGGLAAPLLKELVKPFVLRRLKREVLKELPEKTEVTLRVTLDAAEREQYEACRIDALKGLEEQGETNNRISVLAALTRLRRFCCHPSLVYPEATNGAKLAMVMDLLGELREAGHRVLVFSQFVDFLTIVREAVEDRGWSYRYLDGSTPNAERAESVSAFQKGDGDFFLISLKAGGMGLNLTAANYVVLLDPWWNPAVEDQAADRAHRIGQRLPVTVYRTVVADSVEEKMLAMHDSKRMMSEDLLENALGEKLSTEALLALFH